jgi:hypothetical protein
MAHDIPIVLALVFLAHVKYTWRGAGRGGKDSALPVDAGHLRICANKQVRWRRA